MTDEVRGAAWMTVAPVSRCCPRPANVTPVNSQRAPSPDKMLVGYNMDTREPKEPDTHSIKPPFSTSARFVFRFIMFFDQFSMVE